MHSTTFRKVGGSVMMAIPPALLELLNIQPGDIGTIDVKNGQLVAQPIARQKRRRSSHNIRDLLAQCDFNEPRNDEDELWINSPAIGREIE